MKKENKKMAQQRRAEERKKAARRRLIRNVVLAVLIVGFFAGMIGYGIYDSKKNASTDADTTETTEDTSTDTTTTTDTSDDSDEAQDDSLITDTSYEVADGDTVNIDYTGAIDGFEFAGGSDQGYDLTIGSGTFIDDFEEQLIGHKVGETVEVVVNFPEDYDRTYTDADGNSQSFNGVEATFTVVINGVRDTSAE